MAWGLSICLTEGEKLIDNSAPILGKGIRPLYNVYLTPKRVLFRFNPLKSTLCKAFIISEIESAMPVQRFFMDYLAVRVRGETHYFQTSAPEYWAERINELVSESPATASDFRSSRPIAERGRRKAILRILNSLRTKAIITEPELREKVQRLGP